MNEKSSVPNTDPLDAIQQARGLFEHQSFSKQREEDVELTDRGVGRYGDKGGKVRLFKAGRKTVVNTAINASQSDREYDTCDFDVQTSIQGEPGITRQYDTNYTKERKDDGSHYNVWDTVSPNLVQQEKAETTVVKFDGKKEVFRLTSDNPELAKKVASIASKKIIEQVERQANQEKDIAETIERISQELPSIAQDNVSVEPQNDIVDYLGKSYSARAEYFRDNPDDYLQHAPEWHQHGIITHSREFARAIKTTIPEYIDKWELGDNANPILRQRIDGVEKHQLLEVVGLLHDIGKFSSRTEVTEENSVRSYSYTDHEVHSGAIIRGDGNTALNLKDLGFTTLQIEYIARCAELHFELAKVRSASKKSVGYTLDFVVTSAFQIAAQEIIDTNPDYALEIGLLFIADGLSKTEVMATGDTDEDIAAEYVTLERELIEKGLDPRLIAQAKQMPVNLEVAKAYLNQWAKK